VSLPVGETISDTHIVTPISNTGERLFDTSGKRVEISTVPSGDGQQFFASGKPMSSTISAGRKRAARAWKIPAGTQCEWAGLLRAGGGVVPVVGCEPTQEHIAVAMHHGPDKSTQNNSRENVHFLCSTCHNRWHQLNDEHYGLRPKDNGTWRPKSSAPAQFEHDSETPATLEDRKKNEAYWLGKKVWRAKED
jgi:hypothetical protein